jgi:hypothetical protein
VLEEAVPAAVPADDPDADVVVFAVCVDVLDASPGNWTGISGSVDAADDALPFVLPTSLLVVLVWACAIENPRRTARAKMNVCCIVLSRRKKRRRTNNNSRPIKKENEVSERSGLIL